MNKPIQFSMRRMFASVTLFCLGAAAFSWLARYGGASVALVCLGVFVGGAAFAGSVSLYSKRPVLFAICGGVLLVLVTCGVGRIWIHLNHPYLWDFPFNLLR